MDTNRLKRLGLSAGTSPLDDVVEFANTGSFPVSGQAGKIYVSLQDNKIYRRSGVSYAELSSSSDRVFNAGNVSGMMVLTESAWTGMASKPTGMIFFII